MIHYAHVMVTSTTRPSPGGADRDLLAACAASIDELSASRSSGAAPTHEVLQRADSVRARLSSRLTRQ